ncbi:DNA polymerase III subunit beta [Malacoplasma iowae]|uniref:DNA polymerase III subunit beta n=1 Tax=Malacoplasma iowae TaxID=2116 RepID=UPI0038732C4E|nr:DNA polymerase III subunit beta [Malacoplasma iowae]WPL40976.1 DNA polymerase III subunit beta [Malacoplasma iowae]
MKIKANKNAILNVLKFNNSIIDNTVSSPYIQGILIEAIDNKVYLTSTNSFISAKTTIDKGIQIIEEGKLLVKSRVFFNIISKLKNEEIIIEKVDNSVLKIKTESFDSNINIMDEQQYPNINFDYHDWNEIILPPITFKSAITKIMQSVSQNREKVSILNGICFHGENDKLEVYASDGYKLSFYLLNTKDKISKLL